MNEDFSFSYTVENLPQGKALTVSEIEAILENKLRASEGQDREALWDLAQLYSRTERREQALENVRKLVELTDSLEEKAKYYLNLGQLMEQLSNFTEAVVYYRQALHLEPVNSWVWYFIHNNLGYSLMKLGQYEEALTLLAHAIEIDPRRPNAFKNTGLCRQALGQFKEAAEHFILATQADAADGRSLGHLRELYAEQPQLRYEIDEIEVKIAFCQHAVDLARSQQPDYDAHWKELRQQQEEIAARATRKWWQFWRR